MPRTMRDRKRLHAGEAAARKQVAAIVVARKRVGRLGHAAQACQPDGGRYPATFTRKTASRPGTKRTCRIVTHHHGLGPVLIVAHRMLDRRKMTKLLTRN